MQQLPCCNRKCKFKQELCVRRENQSTTSFTAVKPVTVISTMKLSTKEEEEGSLSTDVASIDTGDSLTRNDQEMASASNSVFAPDANAIRMVPQLANHSWKDDYFNMEDHKQQNIIAVFDHSLGSFYSRTISCLSFPLFMFSFLAWLVVPLFIQGHRDGDRSAIIFASCMLLPTCLLAVALYLLIRHAGLLPPHTAVTLEGVVHMDGSRARMTRVFTWDEIVSTHQSDADDSWRSYCSVLVLNNAEQVYIQCQKEPQLFREVVERLKEMQRTNEGEETAEPRLSSLANIV
ncbi:hypothetical protein MPSEU_000770300 [Mayamaea pseudoterrestris]|nr:hypothetical protein MPSEU_000770300 [Mayamaea pseudoterrestris]